MSVGETESRSYQWNHFWLDYNHLFLISVAAICYTEDLLISTNPSDHGTFKKLYEKLGDGACHLKNYAGAVEYYLKMLEHAELAGDCGKKLIPIYVR